ncbi:MAG: LysR family transcriptional regulator [Rhizobiaceae bacterium]
MKITHIKYFVAVYEEGSFTAAAERENATQPGVSMQIKELETLTGTTLFERSTTGVVPTSAGKWFYNRARQVLSDIRGLEQGIRSLGQMITGTVHAGLMPAFTRNALAPAIDAFSKAFPHAQVHVVEAYSGDLTERVGRGQLDFAIVPTEAMPENISARHFATDREFFVQSSRSGQTSLEPVHLSDLSDLKLILPGSGNTRRNSLNTFFKRHHIQPAEVMELDTMMGTLDLIARGGWSAILPGVLCLSDQHENQRTIHPISEGDLHLDYMLIQSASRPLSEVSSQFVDLLDVEINKLITEAMHLGG